LSDVGHCATIGLAVANRPHVVILGGGYVPITLTRKLRSSIERGEIDATVVSRENYHAFHGFVGEMITGRIGAGSMLSPVRRIFAPRACSRGRDREDRPRGAQGDHEPPPRRGCATSSTTTISCSRSGALSTSSSIRGWLSTPSG